MEAESPKKEEKVKGKARRGFAAMDPKLHAELARRGGKKVHAMGKGHVFTKEEAREAGRKGGLAVHAKRRAAEDVKEETESKDSGDIVQLGGH